jgi:hypothetical protein
MANQPYEAPQVSDLGSLQDLTLVDTKDRSGSDGHVYLGAGLGPVS